MEVNVMALLFKSVFMFFVLVAVIVPRVSAQITAS